MSVNAPALDMDLPGPAPRIGYHGAPPRPDLQTLAVFGFGDAALADDPRCQRVPLMPVGAPAYERWVTSGPVSHGREGGIDWSTADGWLFAAITVDEDDWGGPELAAREVYARLGRFLDRRDAHHVLRMWNYMRDINAGEGDAERYKRFCAGRIVGMGDRYTEGFPAATAIGHHHERALLQVYCLASVRPGERVENPRQLSAWRYPRQYGPTPPSFDRAMRLPGEAALAISGTASITGHASRHVGDVEAQLGEVLANLDALLESGGMPDGFGPGSPLKVYLRDPADADRVEALLAARLPDTPRMLLLGDVCRSELLVELDGWRFV